MKDAFQALAPAMTRDLQELIRIPSFRSAASASAPLGEGPLRALRWVLDWGRARGYRVQEVDSVAGHLEIGEGEDIIGVLVHCDTVPAGDGWSVDPFAGTVCGDRIYGRGACDDKGPLVASLYAFKALAESGQRLTRRVRLIVGSDEESQWECMNAYFAQMPRPTAAFAPDGDFPVITAEKGALLLELEGPGCQGIRFEGGSAPNVVPSRCLVDIGVGPHAYSGLSAHASVPQLGDSAIWKALSALRTERRLPDRGVLAFAARYLCDHYGLQAGVAASDELLGPLTMNLGTLSQDEEAGRGTLDLRLPQGSDLGDVQRRLSELAASFDVELHARDRLAAHVIDPERPFVRTLIETYREHSGDYGSEPLRIGGITYARAAKNAVAFGPVRPCCDFPVHQPDEFFGISDMVFAARVYADALSRLVRSEAL